MVTGPTFRIKGTPKLFELNVMSPHHIIGNTSIQVIVKKISGNIYIEEQEITTSIGRGYLCLVAKVGLEPTRDFSQQILSLSRLPFHHLARKNPAPEKVASNAGKGVS